MDRPETRVVDQAEATRAVSIQTMAFSSDPIMRWLWPEPHEYIRHFPALVHGFGGRAFENGSAYVSEDFLGGSLWLPPGVGPDDDALDALLKDTVSEPALSEILSILEHMGRAHPKQPHWHLAFIGVDPAHHGKGIGAALLTHTLESIDRDGLHSYLESTNRRNITLYERHGFEVVCEIRVGGSPPVFPMLRVPR